MEQQKITTLFTFLFLCAPLAAGDIGLFWHVTDFHYDQTYWTSQLSCNENVSKPGQYGDYWCDSPWLLVQDTIVNMANFQQKVDFILWTGDSVAHIKDANMTLAINLQILENITTALNSSFPQVPVYASLGNHDFYPSNQADYKESQIYLSVAELWKDWISNQTQIESFKEGGYYMARITPKIRLLSLNTNLYYTSNKLTSTVDDPAGQMAWMTIQFEEAKLQGEKVIVTGHVPPGLITPGLTDWFYPKHKSQFMSILLNYSDVIATTHFGHDHSDGFKILQNDNGTRAVTQFTAPSVTPWRYRIKTKTGDPHNPGIRLVSYDKDTGLHINYDQYYINITESNNKGNATWSKLYSFKDDYKVADMSVASLRNIFSQMERDKGNDYTNKYCTHSVVSNYPLTCTDQMKAEIYCGGLYYDLKEAQSCTQKYLNGVSLHQLSSCVLIAAFILEVFFTISL